MFLHTTLFVGLWGVFFGAQIALAAPENVRINEVLYDPLGTDSGLEFIELYNGGSEPVTISGWDIDPSSTPFVTLPTATIPPNGYFVIYINADGTDTDDTFFTGSLANMSNTKGPVAIFSSTDHTEETLIDYIAYGEGGQANESKAVAKNIWQQGAFVPDVDEGQSISFDGAQTWYPGTPTPGAANQSYINPIPDDEPPPAENEEDDSTPSEPADQSETTAPAQLSGSNSSASTHSFVRIIINEFVSDPTDGEEEWVELYNPNSFSVILDDWILEEGSGRQTLLFGTIEPNGFFIIDRPKGNLNNNGDVMVLLNQFEIVVDMVAYGDWEDTFQTTVAPKADDPLATARINSAFIVTEPTKGKPNKNSQGSAEKTIGPTTENELVQQKEAPAALFTIPAKAFIASPVEFDASDSYVAGTDATFLWEFGDGNGLAGKKLSYAYAAAGTYTVTLTVSDGSETSREEKEISIFDDIRFIPFSYEDVIAMQPLRISELMPNPLGNDTEGEWVELHNTGDRLIDLSGWQLDDKDGGSKPYTFPKNTMIQPHAFLVIEREESNIALNNTVDVIRLLDPKGMVYLAHEYAGVQEGLSLIISPEGLIASDIPSPGSEYITAHIAANQNKTPSLSNSDIVSVPHGTEATIEGVVTAPPYLFGKRYFYIQLVTSYRELLPHGIQVYMQNADFPELGLGDIIAVSGIISRTAEEPKLLVSSNESIYFQNANLNVTPFISDIEELSDDDLGSLISISGTVIERSGSSIFVADDTGELRVYKQPNTNISFSDLSPGTDIIATGVLSKTKSGFRLLPRSDDDVQVDMPIVESITSEMPTPHVQTNRSTLLMLIGFIIIAIIIILISVQKTIQHRTSGTSEKVPTKHVDLIP